jgi:hypothetical protein
VRVSVFRVLAPAVFLLPAAVLRADDPAITPAAPAETAASTAWSDPAAEDVDPVRDFVARAGAWGVKATGSPSKVGEYQGLGSSPFVDIDGLFSNGTRTVDLSATANDNDTDNARVHVYGGPQITADVNYDRFPHQLDTNSYAGFTTIPGVVNTGGGSSDNYYSRDDLSSGQDYAIRVQEFKANFKGSLTDDLRWRVNVFGIEKEGVREADALAHCYDASTSNATCPVPPTNETSPQVGPNFATNTTGATTQCHVVTQAQHIDWRTTEVTPSLEWHVGALTVEYSHTIRLFEQADQQVYNAYRGGAGLGFPTTNNTATNDYSTAGYNIVPDSQSQIDRLKAHLLLEEDTDVYAAGYIGDMKDELTESNRHFGGADARITNNSVGGLTLTGYGKYYTENTQMQTTPLNTLYSTPAQMAYYQENMSNLAYAPIPIDRDQDAVGVTSRWRPFYDEKGTVPGGLAFTAGYEYSQLRRTNAGDTIQAIAPAFWIQPNTNKSTATVGVEEKWSRAFTTYVRFKYIDTEYPLYGISPDVYSSLDDALNTMLPTHENRVEIGGTWTPSEHFMLNATFYVENALNNGPFVNFDSTSYPYVLSLWYAPSTKWSFTTGYANFTNWISQDVTLTAVTTAPTTGIPPSPSTAPWNYMGKSQVFNVGANYAWTQRLKLCGAFEYVHGIDAITAVGQLSTGVSFQTPVSLGSYSLVSENTYHVSAGVDYVLGPRVTTFFRYNYYDFGDLATALQSGTVNMFLVGMSAVF